MFFKTRITNILAWFKDNKYICLILLSFAFIRFSFPGIFEYHHDDDIIFFESFKIAQGKSLPLLGVNIREYYGNLGPFVYYLYAFPLLFFKTPIAVSIFEGLLHLLAVFFCYKFTERFFNKNTALISAAFYSGSFFNNFFMKRITNVALVQPLLVIFMFLILESVLKKKLKIFPFSCLCCALLLQTNFGMVYCIILLVLSLLMFFPGFLNLIKGFIFMLLVFSPVVIYEIFNKFSNTFKILQLFSPQHIYNNFSILTLKKYFLIVIHGNKFFLKSSVSMLTTIISIFLVCVLIIAVFYLFYLFFFNFKRREFRICYGLLLAWFFIPLSFLLVYRAGPIPYYYSILVFPAHFIILGIFLNDVLGFFKKHFIKLYRFLISIIIVIIFWSWSMTYIYNKNVFDSGRFDDSVSVEYDLPFAEYDNIFNVLFDKFGFDYNKFVSYKDRLHCIGWRTKFENCYRFLRLKDTNSINEIGNYRFVISLKKLDPEFYEKVIKNGNFYIGKYLSLVDYDSWEYSAKYYPKDGDWVKLGLAENYKIYNYKYKSIPLCFRGKIKNVFDLQNISIVIKNSNCPVEVLLDGNLVFKADYNFYFQDIDNDQKEIIIRLPKLNKGWHDILIKTANCGLERPRHYFFDVLIAKFQE